MSAVIQLKRGTAAAWASANTVLSAGEAGYETDTKKIKIGDGSTAWNSLVYAAAPLASPELTGVPTAPTATSGTSTTQIATTAFVSTAVANIIDSAPATLNTLDELAAALGDDANFATTVTNSLAAKASITGTETLTNKTLNYPIFVAPEENVSIVASAATGTINFDVVTAGILYYTSNATANHTLNIRGNGSTTLSSLLATGGSITVAWINTNGATPYYPNVIQIDGNTITPKWANGIAVSAGNASSIDIYSFTIVKTSSSPTYTVFGSQGKFA